MDSLNKLKEQQERFFNDHFWTVDSRSEYWNNNGKSNITVRPFLQRSKKLYWEKAYLEYLNLDCLSEAAIVAEYVMQSVYTYCIVGNILFGLAPILAPILLAPAALTAAVILGVAWNLIDAACAFILAARDGKNHDAWSKGINLISGTQLLIGTIASVLLTPGIGNIGIQAALGVSTVALSSIAIGASGFAFAAAMFFSWALEHREVELHHARINYLDTKIIELEKNLFYTAFDKNGLLNKVDDKFIIRKANNNYGVGDYPGPNKYIYSDGEFDRRGVENAGEKITYLKKLIANAQTRSDLKEYKDLLELLKFRQHQHQQLESHERNRRVWGLCAVFMTTVAIISVAVIAFGALNVLACGILTPAVYFATLLVSALYRHKPEVFENTAKTIKNNVPSLFFKSTPIKHNQNDNPLPDNLNLTNTLTATAG